ncbi:metallophosphoesterase family protein [Alkalilimnicola ehrlichii MLHE-1]|uniref:Calcineurin-like phosphoesterase domain-containing protein n=1 Tax=Alkalilimnicola ehrlichii (strain ATCC BAA-1101 / DSM 17681 / MLHE-1) TaxID=187272 RepID=Q0A867_ALKEH|nr:hypothetical protein [Alkalilimnicola ehrlichii]ABI56970.1 conserved hypothetical protein [Alkalilimnicola ehrlichii MLHE-1]
MSQPGRLCPLHYQTGPDALRTAPLYRCPTVYLVGGLYGNDAALAAIQALAHRERAAGHPEPLLVFNGDFHWLDADPAVFRHIQEAVLNQAAILGNVEAELAQPTPGIGCGCAYPETVDDATVMHSNRIMARLQRMVAETPALHDVTRQLSGLPRQIRLAVGDLRVGVIHGDPESLAGWRLALEQMPAPGRTTSRIRRWFEVSEVDLFACSHTCLPFAQRFTWERRQALIFNNGAAGLPNFRGDRRGVITRIAETPAPVPALYGGVLRGVHCDAVPVAYDTAAWARRFRAIWPEGSAACHNYARRLAHGTGLTPQAANRLGDRRP